MQEEGKMENKKENKYVIGLTGGIGAGKSTVSSVLEEYGATDYRRR